MHALSVVACGIDEDTGEVFRRRLSPDYGEALAWLRTLPSAVKVVYEAGPTGFGLCRALTAAAVECVVVAASKLQRPAGDRIKTDARDALHLARLLQLSEIVEVSVPSVEQEAARDLVRAREDARGDLMRCRHRLSKLPLRQGLVYSGGAAWTAAHDVWLRGQNFDQPALQAAFYSDYEAMILTLARRDRLDAAIADMAEDSPYTQMVRRLGRLRGVSTLTAFGLAVEIEDWQRFTGNTIGASVGLVASEYSYERRLIQGPDTVILAVACLVLAVRRCNEGAEKVAYLRCADCTGLCNTHGGVEERIVVHLRTQRRRYNSTFRGGSRTGQAAYLVHNDLDQFPRVLSTFLRSAPLIGLEHLVSMPVIEPDITRAKAGDDLTRVERFFVPLPSSLL
nr:MULTISPECIES: transposase [Rhodococcus]